MVDFICMDLLDLLGTRTENYKMKSACPQWDSNPGPSAYEVNTLSDKLLELINIDHITFTAFYLSFLCELHMPRVHLVLPVLFLKILSCIFSYNICIVLLFDLF